MVGGRPVMKRIGRLLAILWQPALFFIWLVALVSLLLDQQYIAFLRPEFVWVLILAGGILVGFLRAGVTNLRAHNFGISEALRALILLMPLVYLLNVQGASLDAYTFRNRSLGLPSLQGQGNGDVPPLAAPLSDDLSKEAGDTVHTITLADVYRSPRRYTDRRVKLIGQLHKDEQAIQELGASVRVIFRFAVNCCTADATPLALFADVNDTTPLSDLAESSWVEAEGIFCLQEGSGQCFPILGNATLRKTRPPKRPYLF